MREAQGAAAPGVRVGEPSTDFDAVMARMRERLAVRWGLRRYFRR